VPLYSGSGITVLLGLPDHEDEGTTILRNIRNYLPNNTSSHPKKTSSLEMLLQKLQMLHGMDLTGCSIFLVVIKNNKIGNVCIM
jgi:hypothetical protein